MNAQTPAAASEAPGSMAAQALMLDGVIADWHTTADGRSHAARLGFIGPGRGHGQADEESEQDAHHEAVNSARKWLGCNRDRRARRR